MVNNAYDAILKGTPKNTSADRWYNWQLNFLLPSFAGGDT
jgi:hypothetical protein